MGFASNARCIQLSTAPRARPADKHGGCTGQVNGVFCVDGFFQFILFLFLDCRAWICVGTSRGYISLWDVRYNVMSKLWRHSSHGPIHRLASCKSLPRVSPQQQQQAFHNKSEYQIGSVEGSYLFVAAGNNEVGSTNQPG